MGPFQAQVPHIKDNQNAFEFYSSAIMDLALGLFKQGPVLGPCL